MTRPDIEPRSTAQAAAVTVGGGYVPVIDLSEARAGDPDARATTARVIGRVCESSGFMAVVGHGIPDATIQAMHDATRRLFALPAERKLALATAPDDPLQRGFRPIDTHSSGYASSDDPRVAGSQDEFVPDLCEMFAVVAVGEPEARELSAAAPPSIGLPNKWPNLPGFREAWLAYYRDMDDLARDVMRLLALALELPEHWFDDKIDNPLTALAANYYPPQRVAPLPGQLRKGAHGDWGSLTLLYQDGTVGGLQVMERAGAWIDVPVIPGSFILNLGDLMSIWTNDRWVSTLHRVANPSPEDALRERLSVAFFHEPNYDASIACIPTCTTPEDPPRHAPTTAGAYLLDKIARSVGPAVDAASD